MKSKKFEFSYKVYESIDELEEPDRKVLEKAREITREAYAPYSHFHVGAAAIVDGGEMVTGTNQENASFPVGICAERSLLATAANLFPGRAIKTMAISYATTKPGNSDKPISPCGMCRQAILEYQARGRQPMRIILGGQTGSIYVIERAESLLPFAFSSEELSGRE